MDRIDNKENNSFTVTTMSRFEQRAPISLYVADVVDGHLIKEGEEAYSPWVLITANNEKVYLIRIVGTIIDKFYSPTDGTKKSFTTLTIDDSSATIRLKEWEEQAEFLNSFTTGNNIDVIGKPRKSDDEIYILPEKVIKIDEPNKELYLRARRIRRYSKNNLIVPKHEQIQAVEHNQEQKEQIFNLIADTEKGINLEEIIEITKLDKNTVESIIHELLNNGDVYEPSALKFKKI